MFYCEENLFPYIYKIIYFTLPCRTNPSISFPHCKLKLMKPGNGQALWKLKALFKKKSFLARIQTGPVSSQESTLLTAPLKRTTQVLHKERISSPHWNSKETAHVTTLYSWEPLSKTFNFPSSRVAPSFISKTVHNLEVYQNLHSNATTTKNSMPWLSLVNTDSP